MKPVIALAALFLAVAGCAAQAGPPSAPTPTLKGEVLESRDVDSYTYLRLKTADGETWAAVQTTVVKKGDQVTIFNPMTMDNFESKALKTKFETIVFGEIDDPNAKVAAAHSASPAAGTATLAAKVAMATGPDARTIAEVVQGRSALKDKTVLVRGQVVKVSAGILGKNWLHLQDGSGAAADGSNDILVTTRDEAAVGAIVNARGTVRTDVSVGAGYAFAVLIEDAAVHE